VPGLRQWRSVNQKFSSDEEYDADFGFSMRGLALLDVLLALLRELGAMK
jgi:hypothetical protein